MAADKNSRDKQARDAERRQRERAVLAELKRGDEPEPPVEPGPTTEIESELESLTYPVTGHDVVDAVGHRAIQTVEGSTVVGELIADTTRETFESPSAVLARVQWPTVAGAMRRIVVAAESLPETISRGTPFTAYGKTLQALRAIEADDDDEGVQVISDWILERITVVNELPGSRAVRRKAANYCREHGYAVQSDDWLGV